MLENYVPPYTATVVEKLQKAGEPGFLNSPSSSSFLQIHSTIEGGLMIGKTNMDEFSMGVTTTQSHFGPTKNPWTLMCYRRLHPEKSPPELLQMLEEDWLLPGGSSGGSAVAVACDIARMYVQ